jgi:hypothetical protein
MFQIGSRIMTTANLNVRNKGQTQGSKILCTQPAGALGTLTSGPSGKSGYTWWNINFDASCDGWSVQDYLSTNLSAPVAAGSPVGQTAAFTLSHTLAKGWSGPEVSLLQQLLNKVGVYTGEITGYFGPATEQSVMTLQQQNNLSAVGIVGPMTRALLNNNLGN